MSMNQQPAPTTTIVPAAAPMNQNEYQKIYVDTLVDITTLTIRTSWPMEISTTKEGQPVVNTHAFVRHLLKRSRATRSTLQLAIFYLFRIRPHINRRSEFDPIVKCGRRMFLAALICAHKYLYDNTFTNASWAKISKLPVKEINQAERALLEMLDYRLYVSTELYQKFESQLKEAIPISASASITATATTIHSKKRVFEESPITNISHPIKKTRSQNYSHHLVHGIPTPEDDKVEL
ncbi:hypothetical protein HPULCUR_004427 [Helicostylum pulchrum]|uniref:Uncharacterized protein n=1 Tax=Helicostylum pulchrum TaxID=562976 RepID=A0ABP9XW74_9FUNG